jgi:hypothetical protein
VKQLDLFPHPGSDFEAMLQKAREAYYSLTREERDEMWRAQKISWVRGQIGCMSNRDMPAYEEIAALVDRKTTMKKIREAEFAVTAAQEEVEAAYTYAWEYVERAPRLCRTRLEDAERLLTEAEIDLALALGESCAAF